MKKRACADRTNIPVESAASTGKPTPVKPVISAADRRARARALLDGPAVADDEGAGECNQS